MGIRKKIISGQTAKKMYFKLGHIKETINKIIENKIADYN